MLGTGPKRIVILMVLFLLTLHLFYLLPAVEFGDKTQGSATLVIPTTMASHESPVVASTGGSMAQQIPGNLPKSSEKPESAKMAESEIWAMLKYDHVRSVKSGWDPSVFNDVPPRISNPKVVGELGKISERLRKAKVGTSSIPKIIHQIYIRKPGSPLYWDTEVLDQVKWFSSFSRLNPEYEHIIWTNEVLDDFVKAYFPADYYTAYKKLPQISMRSDYLRYALVWVFGGVFSDADTECLRPIDDWYVGNANVSFLGAVEWNKNYNKHDIDQIASSTFAAKPNNPIIGSLLAKMTENTNQAPVEFLEHVEIVMLFTGPPIFTTFIKGYLEKLNETFDALPTPNDVVESKGFTFYETSRALILPINSFKADSAWCHSFGTDHPLSFLNHYGTGSWSKGWRKNPINPDSSR